MTFVNGGEVTLVKVESLLVRVTWRRGQATEDGGQGMLREMGVYWH